MNKSRPGLGQDHMRITRINTVVQEDATGCGIACAAMLAGVTYQHAKQAATQLGIQVSDSRLWSDTVLVRRVLENHKPNILECFGNPHLPLGSVEKSRQRRLAGRTFLNRPRVFDE